MRTSRRGAYPGFACLLVSLVVGCGRTTTPLSRILEHPRDYVGRHVTVSGTAEPRNAESGDLMLGMLQTPVKTFILYHAKDSILVLTLRPLPGKGEKLAVRGIVRGGDFREGRARGRSRRSRDGGGEVAGYGYMFGLEDTSVNVFIEEKD